MNPTGVGDRPAPRPRRGRPPSTEVERAVFAEAIRLVGRNDPASLTRLAIAEGAGVSRQTLYNRWPTTADIVLDALLDRAAGSIGDRRPAGETGLDGLRAYLVELAGAVDGWARPGLRAVAAFAQLDDDFARRFRRRFLATRHRALTEAIAEAAPRLEPAPVTQAAELVAGSLWFRILVADEPLDDRWVGQMVALVATADGARSSPESPM
ncbi:MAG: TetR/AcrR family transcriptional regulator C-terminal ligand-binding domain-containing protein [Actinomycetota bacterium]